MSDCLFKVNMMSAAVTAAILPGMAVGASHWNTDEYRGGNFLDPIKASGAYDLGFTGKGVVIGIIDQPVMIGHPELQGKVTDYEPADPTFNWAQLTHGTHVAGIAAAKRDGVGMHGVAFDADLATVSVWGNR